MELKFKSFLVFLGLFCFIFFNFSPSFLQAEAQSFEDFGESIKFYWDLEEGVELEVPVFDSDSLQNLEEYKTTFRFDDEDDSGKTGMVSVQLELASSSHEFATVAEEDDDLKDEDKDEDEKDKDKDEDKKDESPSSSFFSLEEVKDLPEDKAVTTEGVVVVEPGVLGSQYFYISGSPGIQIYNYFQDFPDLEKGDRIQVSGEVSISHGEKRINTSEAEDIQILGKEDLPSPTLIECSEIEENTANFVSVQGEVTQTGGNSFYLDDQVAEVRVYLQDHLDVSDISEGDELEVVGLVNKFRSDPRLLPRSDEDIKLVNSGEDNDNSDQEEVTTSSSDNSDKLILSSQAQNSKWTKYLSEVLFLVVIVLLIVLIKEQREGKQNG